MKGRNLLMVLSVSIIQISCDFGKPRVLIIGDSISIGYTPYVRDYFSEVARVRHNPGNAQHTGTGLYYINEWLDGKEWDVIQFNWGLWDLYQREVYSKNRIANTKKINREITCTIEEYMTNLDAIIAILKTNTNAKLIFVTTTYVPKNGGGRFENDAIQYNNAAKIIMEKHSIPINDIYEPSKQIHEKFGMGIANVHYTDEGYRKLSELIINFLEPEINQIRNPSHTK